MITVFYCFVKRCVHVLMYLNVYLCSCVSGYMHLCAHGGQKKALEFSELELRLFVGLLAYHMNAGTQTARTFDHVYSALLFPFH